MRTPGTNEAAGEGDRKCARCAVVLLCARWSAGAVWLLSGHLVRPRLRIRAAAKCEVRGEATRGVSVCTLSSGRSSRSPAWCPVSVVVVWLVLVRWSAGSARLGWCGVLGFERLHV
jgi:hypothetical protein